MHLLSGEVKFWDAGWRALGNSHVNMDHVTHGCIAPDASCAILVGLESPEMPFVALIHHFATAGLRWTAQRARLPGTDPRFHPRHHLGRRIVKQKQNKKREKRKEKRKKGEMNRRKRKMPFILFSFLWPGLFLACFEN
jgi:hypothetical protein